MTPHWADLTLVAVIVVAGYVAVYLLAMRKARQTLADSHRELERRLQSLTEAVTMLNLGPEAELLSTDTLQAEEIDARPGAALSGRPLQRIEVRNGPPAIESEDIAPEIQAAIAAAAIATLGNHARVLAARRVPSQDVVSPWTQQGRMIVQSSHNLRTRGR